MPQRPSIDIHAHFYPLDYLQAVEKHGAAFGVGCDLSDADGPRIALGPAPPMRLARPFIDIDARIAEMDELGVGMHALSLTIPMVGWAGDELALRLSQAFNDAVGEAHAKHPQRLVGFATLPWRAPELAAKELERAARIPGIRGVYSATRIGERELGDEEFFPVYERMEALGLPLFLHPVDVVDPQRLRRYYLNNLLGNPFESAIAAAHLIFGGALDRFPGMEVCLPHAGGAFPYLVGRLHHGWKKRPELRHLETGPMDYLRRLHYDTINHAPEGLAYLIGLVGADRVMLGSDYCFDMGPDRPVEVVTGHPDIGAAEAELILSGNAERLLRL